MCEMTNNIRRSIRTFLFGIVLRLLRTPRFIDCETISRFCCGSVGNLGEHRVIRALGIVTDVVVLATVFSFAVARCYSQQEISSEKGSMFVSSVDANSSVPFSTVDAARRSRPPQPAKTHEDLWYPTGFLTLSTPTPEEDRSSTSVTNTNPVQEKRSSSFRPIDASVETTPYAQVPPVRESVKKKGDSALFFALSIALAGLGLFLYYDFLYKNQLRENLVQNAKLCSPKAVSADFDAVLALAPELTDPREPSFVEPTFDPDSLFYDEFTNNQDRSVVTESFEATGTNSSSEANIAEENFDFSPKRFGSVGLTDDVVEDFVVGAGSTL